MRARTEHASARAKTLASSSSLDRVEGRLRDELMRLRIAVEAEKKPVAGPAGLFAATSRRPRHKAETHHNN
jgi:hypothetical protein